VGKQKSIQYLYPAFTVSEKEVCYC